MGTGAISEQPQLLLLDPVLHLASGAVDLVIELLGIAVEIGDDKSWITPLCGDLELGDHCTLAPQRLGAIAQVEKDSLLFLGFLEALFHVNERFFDHSLQPLIARQADNVAHTVALTPAQHMVTAEARVGPQNDPHGRPGLA